MSGRFKPVFRINSEIAKLLMEIEASKERASSLPVNPSVMASLLQTAKLSSVHYSTMIEGNRLTLDQVEQVVVLDGHFAGRQRDELEVKGYYAGLSRLEIFARDYKAVSEDMIRIFHGLVCGGGREKVRPTNYRDGQNVIKDSSTGSIVYLPPEAKDVPGLMADLVAWIRGGADLPCPIVAAIAHYQFATIHPFYDGNGRTARLLTTLILHQGGYDLKNLYSLEEYYARDLPAYYQAITVGPSHNYYLGRAESDITGWVEYFCRGMAVAFGKVVDQMQAAQERGESDASELMQTLDPKQRKALELFRDFRVVTSSQVGELFGFKPRTSSLLCKTWVDSGFLEIVDTSKKARSYKLSGQYVDLVKKLGGL